MKNLTKTDIDIIFFAFRYALGRRTRAVSQVADYLKSHWAEIDEQTQLQIKTEIAAAIDQDQAGHNCDVESWLEVRALPLKGGENP